MNNNLEAKIEALLFTYGEKMGIKRIANITQTSEDAVKTALEALENQYQSEARGLVLLRDEEKVQLVTKPEFKTLVSEIIKKELTENISPAALETLAIIAYAGPVSRSMVDFIRGVNSAFTVRALSMRGLIEKNEGKQGHSFHYQISFEFLKHLGFTKQEELPEFTRFHELVQNFQNTQRQ
ncbi:MAG: SMC-Scp complex subunit ScpB [Candidatus Harrisonbacteria bacterium CG10_big_fil_rev_8_21_14_0_10_42_17]|uniref:SMC-Scp complex subunit ScpB n=1 Tax=Candidatus Harrisonbacteria bacterium CG10_big_fil_rev_8_21_14_0_10_42_17 TaxID=1974584 RepID=A0A2M6WHP1_9BACT|nr:MAG: SMC-Scp complex subunit ScpB [Candidatus Harrisonbacteria bacterium CG10_big_fil_rev_8_21_14_0_10_42_17]